MNTHTIYIVAMLACFFAAGVNAIWFGSELRRFLANTPSISTPLDMFRFKKVVAHQMYAALVQIVLLLAPIALFFLGVMTDALAPSDLLFVVVPSAVIIVIAISFKSLESQAKSIPTADSELEAQRDAVVQTWLRKPFPNW